MSLAIVYFFGAFLLLIALIYGMRSYHHRDRAAVRAAEEATRRRYREDSRGGEDRLASDVAPPTQPEAPRKVREPNGIEPAFSEDDIQRDLFGPRGVPGAPDPAKMTPQRQKKTPGYIDQGHVS
jgi:hypothetical protein